MKKTGSLNVSVSSSMDRIHLALHPNDGFDLGLMRVQHPVQLCHSLDLEDYLKGTPGEAEDVQLQLLNECPPRTMIVGLTLFRLLGEPAKAVVLYDGQRLFVHGQSL